MNNSAIQIRSVFFSYRTPHKEDYFKGVSLPIKKVTTCDKQVLTDVNLDIEENKITALLGRNGSGKTTLIKLITGARTPAKGKITVLGKNPVAARGEVGVCFGGSLIYNRLTARENLEYFARLYGIEDPNRRIEELGELLEISDVLDDMIESYSFGMKMKVAVARSLIHNPKVLILDEPTLGLDIQLAVSLRKFIQNLKCTTILTTHYMEEAQELADNLCFIDHGKIHAAGTKQVVLEKYNTSTVSQAFLEATSP